MFTIRRKAARVVLLDHLDRIFLIRSVDPADRNKPAWWETPGGGLDAGESSEDAILRELREEAGLLNVKMGPCVWLSHSQFEFGGFAFDQHERIHVAWCDETLTEIDPTNIEALEALAFTGSRWWPTAELLASDEPTVPPRLREFLPAVLAGTLPDEPIDITP